MLERSHARMPVCVSVHECRMLICFVCTFPRCGDPMIMCYAPVQSPTPSPFACRNQDCVTQCGGYCDAQFGCICPNTYCASAGYGGCNWYNSGSQFCQCPGGVACGKWNSNANQCQNTPLMTSPLVKAPAFDLFGAVYDLT